MSEKNEKLSEAADHPLSNRDPNNKKEWVKFEEEDGKVKCSLECITKRCFVDYVDLAIVVSHDQFV